MSSPVRATRSERTASVVPNGRDLAVASRTVSINYQSILESAIEGLHCKTYDARRDIYDEARAAVDRLRLPHHITERERLVLDATIDQIEQELLASQVGEPHSDENAEEFSEPATSETSVENIDPESLSIVPANVNQPYTSARQTTTLLTRRLSSPMILVAALTMLVTFIAALPLGNTKKARYGAPVAARLSHLDTT